MEVSGHLSGKKDFAPVWMLVGWQAGERELRATHHAVVNGEPAAGQLAGRDQIVNLLRDLLGATETRSLPPAHVLFADSGRMLWYRPSQRRPIFFHTGRKEFDAELRGKSAVYPALLFLAVPGNLYVWALASDERPEANTPVYRAPFLNLYESGHMCAGTSKLPLQVSGDVGPFERAFFETTFTHSNYRDKLTTHSGGHDGLWRALAHPERQTFPADCLFPLAGKGGKALTVGEVLNLEVRE